MLQKPVFSNDDEKKYVRSYKYYVRNAGLREGTKGGHKNYVKRRQGIGAFCAGFDRSIGIL